MAADLLLVSLGATHGLREADAELARALGRAGVEVALVTVRRPPEVRTFALTDLVWALAARRAVIGAPPARAVLYSSVTAALLAPRPGAIRFDAPAAGNRPGRHGIWQRRGERVRLERAPLLVPWSAEGLAEAGVSHDRSLVVPMPVEPSAAVAGKGAGAGGARDLTAITYAANPHKKGFDRVLAAWRVARREGEELLVAGVSTADAGGGGAADPGVRYLGALRRDEYRALLRRSRIFITAPRREDYGIAQLEALADGCVLVTTPSRGPYAALSLARALDPRCVAPPGAPLASAIRAALDTPSGNYAARAGQLLEPWRRAAVDRVVAQELVPRLLGRSA